MNTQTQAAEAVGSSEELGHLFVGEAYHQWLTQPAADAMRCVDTRAAFEAGWSAAMAAERDRCAKLCEDEARIRTEAGNTQAEDSESRGRCFAAARAAMNCAKGIRGGELL